MFLLQTTGIYFYTDDAQAKAPFGWRNRGLVWEGSGEAGQSSNIS